MNVLFVCTSNKDRSPALEKYFKENYSDIGEFKSCGINRYFTKLHNTEYISQELIDFADFIIYAEEIHKKNAEAKFPNAVYTENLVLGMGDYANMEVYVKSAKQTIVEFILDNRL